jgi:hypothetical protein
MQYQTTRRASLKNAFPMRRHFMAGLGAGTPAPSTTQLVQQAGSVASAGTVAAIQATVGASGGTILGMSASLAAPIIGAAILGVTIAIEAILNSGCGQTCIVASNWANNAATQLEQNITAYFSNPAPRTAEMKAQALANFDSIWNYLYSQCSSPSLGNAGVACIQDRMAGACKWTQTGQPEFPGQPAYGACWNWFNAFRDPIANDPAIVTQTTIDPSSVINTGGSSTSTIAGIDMSTIALFGGAGLLLFALAGSN